MYKYLQVYAYYLILCTIYTRPLSVQAQYSKLCPISSSFRYNGSLVTWKVVCLTAAKIQPLIISMTGLNWRPKVKVTLRLTVSQSVSLGIEPHLGPMTRYLFLSDSYVLVSVGRPAWREDGSVFCTCRWLLPEQTSSGPSPLRLATVFYCLRFETSLFVASYDSQGHGGGIRPRHCTGGTDGFSTGFLLFLLGGWDRNHLEEFCFSYPC
jgi:hypothetical protein